MTRRKVRVEVFKGKGEQPWFWRIRWANGNIACVSEGYAQHGTCTTLANKIAKMLDVLTIQM